MIKNEIILLEDRGLISITGDDAKNFLQNIITNDIEKSKQILFHFFSFIYSSRQISL